MLTRAVLTTARRATAPHIGVRTPAPIGPPAMAPLALSGVAAPVPVCSPAVSSLAPRGALPGVPPALPLPSLTTAPLISPHGVPAARAGVRIPAPVGPPAVAPLALLGVPPSLPHPVPRTLPIALPIALPITLPITLPIALVALAGAAICWPIRPARYRLRGLASRPPGNIPGEPPGTAGEPPGTAGELSGTAGARHRYRALWARLRGQVSARRPGVLAGPLAAGLLGWLIDGIGFGLALALAAGTAQSRWRARRSARYQLAAATGLADAVRALAAELRTGSHPAVAAESIAAEMAEPAAGILGTAAAAARLGADVGTAVRHSATEFPTLANVLRPLAQAWSLADRHGLPLADLLDTAGRDLDGRIRFANQVRARMAGPKASAAVLAGLPVLGLLLGEGMGAQPVRVLLVSGAGQLLLALGIGLACAGIRWTARITERSVLP